MARMTQAEALKAAQKLLGKRAWVEHNPKSPSKKEREAVSAEYKAAKEAGTLTKELAERWRGAAFWRRYRVGLVQMGLCFVEGAGDTWQEALADAARRRERFNPPAKSVARSG